jgi:hypothetical protein
MESFIYAQQRTVVGKRKIEQRTAQTKHLGNFESKISIFLEDVMLERIRTFFGRVMGLHEKKRTIVAVGTAWACTKCRLVFLTKREGDKHECAEIYGNGI